MSDPHHPTWQEGASSPAPAPPTTAPVPQNVPRAAPADVATSDVAVLAEVSAELPQELRPSVAAATSAALARLPEVLPWYPRLDSDRRREIEVLAASGVASFFRWYIDPSAKVTARSLLAAAPPDLARSVNLQETLGLIRAIVETVERGADELAPDNAGDALRIAALRYANDIAFSVAKVYARAAETRGAWDARLEATVVDALLRGSTDPGILSRISALGWHSSPGALGAVIALDGTLPGASSPLGGAGGLTIARTADRQHQAGSEGTGGDGMARAAVAEEITRRVRKIARQSGTDHLVGVQGDRLILILGAHSDDRLVEAVENLLTALGSPRAAIGPTVSDVLQVGKSLRPAFEALRVAPAWPHAPRTVHSDDVLPERAMAGDPDARARLVERIYEPLLAAQSPLLHTLDAYWAAGLGIEATARSLFVHTNTVRYRLHRVADLIGWDPTDPREGFVVRIGVAMGRLPRTPQVSGPHHG